MQDRPTALELLEAVREFLEKDVMPEVDGRRRFHTRVAINVLGIVARELEHEEEAIRDEWQRLARLFESAGEPPATLAAAREAVRELNTELSRRVQEGEFDVRWKEVFEALRATVAEKLAIANPRYADDGDERTDGEPG